MTNMHRDTGNSFSGAAKRVFLETFGCQMNENDSGRMLAFLKDINYIRTESVEDADLVLINTCSIRDKAEQKVYSTLGRFKALKKERPSVVIGVAGCVAQQEGGRLLKRVPYLDMVLGPHNIHKLKDMIGEVAAGKKRVAATEINDRIDDDEYSAVEPPAEGVKAFVSIMRGCDNFCAYCIVPYTRGREVSRRTSDIVEEVGRLASSGVKEVTLLGQNVNSYGPPEATGSSFTGLLREVCGISGIERVRFVTSHPKDISEELIRLFGEEKKLCRHIHLPAQSGSDAVLRAMGRGYTRDEYISKAGRLKALYPGMAITTDIIVGFPGETAEDFQSTIDLIREVRFDNIFSFMYSQRPGTKAAGMKGHLGPGVKSERLKTLQGLQKDITLEKNRGLIGMTMTVLVEGPSKADHAEYTGRTGCGRIVNFPATSGGGVGRGSMTDVLITGAYQNSLRGVCAEGGAICS